MCRDAQQHASANDVVGGPRPYPAAFLTWLSFRRSHMYAVTLSCPAGCWSAVALIEHGRDLLHVETFLNHPQVVIGDGGYDASNDTPDSGPNLTADERN